MKRFLIACNLVCTMCTVILADTEIVDGIEWTYTVSDGKAIIHDDETYNTAIPYETKGSVTIPSTLGGYPVTSIGDSTFSYCDSLTHITISNSIIAIERRAFSSCDGLMKIIVTGPNPTYQSIDGVLFNKDLTSLIRYPMKRKGTVYTIPSSVTSIAHSAFYECEDLTHIIIPDGVTSIGDQAFQGCLNLISITIPNSVTVIGDEVFEGCENLTVFNVTGQNPAYQAIDGVLFDKSLTTLISYPSKKQGADYTIPNGITSIANIAFYGCEGLSTITIPNSVVLIGDQAFQDCVNLTSMTIPTGVTSINSATFYNCENLVKVTIPNSITSIGKGAFYGCLSLTEITIPNSVVAIDEFAFYGCKNLTEITIPNEVTSINRATFYTCENLTEIAIPNGVTSIEDSAFSGCQSLTEVTLPNSVITIGEFAFYNCENLKDITIPNSVISIGDRAFDNDPPVYQLVDGVSFNKSLTTLVDYPSAKKQTHYVIPSSVTSIGESAFEHCMALTLTIPNSVTFIGRNAFYWCHNLTTIIIDDTHPTYTLLDGVLFDKSLTTLICYPPGRDGSFYTIPESVTSIAPSAFLSCINLTNITIPDSVTSIGENAFMHCGNLITVTISNRVTAINEGTFAHCSSLSSVTIPDRVISIGDDAFLGCNDYDFTHITIPSSVISIGDNAIPSPNLACIIVEDSNPSYQSIDGVLLNKNLTSIILYPPMKKGAKYTIPSTVTSIGKKAFSNCYILINITIPDSVITIAEDAFWGCGNLKTEIPKSRIVKPTEL